MNQNKIMEKTKLKSLRIPESTLEEIQAFVATQRYTKEHAILVSILDNLFNYADYETLKTLYLHFKHSNKKLIITVTEQ